MRTLTIRLPDDTHKRLKYLAEKRQISVNKLFEEFSTTALAEFDAEARFLAQSARGNPERGLALLDKIDQYFGRNL
jgi:predicted transcriptional regulator